MRVSAEVDERTLREIYLPAFERVITRAHPWTVMCSYNRINGTYASQDPWLLTKVLREEWGYEGLVVSDWGAVYDRVAGVAAGLDLEMPSSGGRNDARVVEAVREGRVTEADLNRAAVRVLTLVARAQPAIANPGGFDADAHHTLAREVAARAAVLLKNDGALPLNESVDDVVLLGELARTPRYQGAGSSQVNPTRLVSMLDALTKRGLDVPFAPGYRLAEAAGAPGQAGTDEELRAEAVALASGKTAVLALGLPAIAESEGYDRDHIELPISHRSLLAEVAAVAKRVVVLLANGAVVSLAEWECHTDAILELWLGGQAGGQAAVDLLLGDAAPAGRLAESVPERLEQVPAQLNFPGENGVVRYGEGPFIGYRGLDATGAQVSYPFGHGLTYTTFTYTDLAVDIIDITDATHLDDTVAQVALTVTNAGDRHGVAVPQLYVARPDSALVRAPRELRSFTRVELAPSATARVELTLTRRDLSHWDVTTHTWAVEPGAVDVAVGASSRDLPLTTRLQVCAPLPRVPLTQDSTIREWLDHPDAGLALIEAMGDLADLFGPDSEDPATGAFLQSMPVKKVPMMGISQTMTFDDLDELLARYAHLA